MRAAGVWRLCLTCLTCRTCLTSWCAPVSPEGLLAAVGNDSGEDLPFGWLLLIGAPNKNLVFLVFLVFLASAARLALQTSAVIQNLCADLPQGYARQLDDCGGVRVAAAWRLLMDQMDQMDQMDNVGAP